MHASSTLRRGSSQDYARTTYRENGSCASLRRFRKGQTINHGRWHIAHLNLLLCMPEPMQDARLGGRHSAGAENASRAGVRRVWNGLFVT
eukprot:scaffold58162_cov33-Tisochrysis_lutea.AAC.3